MDEATIGRYQVIRELGRGGMGRVFLARDPQLRRDVALKLLHRDAADDPEAIERFRDEARHAAALRHPNIVTIHEIGQHGEQDFIVMEYLPGRSLRHLLASPSRPPTAEVLRIAKLVAEALATAHATRLLHRDVKPENVVVSSTGEVKVVDFGLARRLQERAPPPPLDATPARRARSIADALIRRMPSQADRLTVETARPPTAPDVANAPTVADAEVSTATETLCGTPAYMAPEILHGQAASAASDVYALGVTLYEALAGKRPFEGGSFCESLEHAIDPDVRAPPLEGVAPAIAALVARMLDKEPAKRPAMTEVAKTLADAVDPMLAAVAKARRRTRLAIALGAVVVAVATLGVYLRTRTEVRGDTRLYIAPIEIEKSLGVHRVAPESVADTLAIVLLEWGAAKPISPREDLRSHLNRASAEPLSEQAVQQRALAAHATLLLVGKVEARGAQLVAHLELVEVVTGRRRALAELVSESDLSQILDRMARAVAARLEPDLVLPQRGERPQVADELVRRGSELTNRNNWFHARPYLELAVVLAPVRYLTWIALARTRAWNQVPAVHTLAALEQARVAALRPPESAFAAHDPLALAVSLPTEVARLAAESRRTLAIIDGIALFYREDYARAVSVLGSIDRRHLDPDLDLELEYHLGEAYWHDGQHTLGLQHLKAVLARSDQRFKHAAKHVAEYAIARGDTLEAERYTGLLEDSRAPTDFAMGRYDEAAKDPNYTYLVDELFVDFSRTEEHERRMDPLSRVMHRTAVAFARRDPAVADRLREVQDALEREQPPISAAVAYQFEMYGELLICADRPRELETMLETWRHLQGSSESVGLERIAIFGAAMSDKIALPAAPRSTRLRRSVAAIAAVRRGDHALATTALRQLIADPSGWWEYPERCTLARLLHRVQDHAGLEELCRELVRPKLPRLAALPIAATCEDWTGHSRVTWPSPRR